MERSTEITLLVLASLLFLLSAFVTCNQLLTQQLEYKLPFHMRWRDRAIRRFWMIDLGLSCLAFLAIGPFGGDVPGKLIDHFLPGPFHPSYLLSATLLGFLWRSSDLSFAVPGVKRDLSISGLRDFFLGSSTIESINSGLHETAKEYVERVIEAVGSAEGETARSLFQLVGLAWVDSPDQMGAKIPKLRDLLLKCARKDFGALHRSVSRIIMIPPADPLDLLMRIEDITRADARRLQKAGLRTPWCVARAASRDVPGIASERMSLLRQNARRFIGGQWKTRVILISLAGSITVALWKLPPLFREPDLPASHGEAVSPQATSPEDARGKYAAL